MEEPLIPSSAGLEEKKQDFQDLQDLQDHQDFQRAMLNILEDSDLEKIQMEQSLRAFLNILEDIDIEKIKVTQAYQQIEMVNIELEDFAYAASHDLKAPLRVIDNASKWIEEDLQEHLTDETRENMILLRSRVMRMENLLDDLLEYSRIGRTEDDRYTEIIAGDVLIANILALLSPPVCFTVTISPHFTDIQVPRMPLQQILMNLISNAIKHHDKKMELLRSWWKMAIRIMSLQSKTMALVSRRNSMIRFSRCSRR